MNPTTSTPATMTIPLYGVREGITYTYPDGSEYFIWQLKRGMSFAVRLEQR